MKSIFYLLAAILMAGCGAGSAEKGTPDRIRTPEEELAGFTLPDGFVIELVASEEDGVINPVDLTFDDQGRLWTQTASMYPLDPVKDIKWNDLLALMNDTAVQNDHPDFKRISDLYKGKTKGVDKILILSGIYDDQHAVKTTVWAEGLAIPMSVLPYKDGAYVAQGSELFFLDDTNGDGKSDQRTPMFTGFGFTDTHTMAHVLIRGPGDWIYFSHGALNKGKVSSFHSDVKLDMNYSKIARFSLDAKKMELVSSGLNNIWGFQLRGNGQWYASEANDLGYSVVPIEPGTGFPGIGNERLRSYQPWMPELHEFRVGGTGISGLAFSDDLSGSFPSEWKDVALLANPITSSINAVKIVRNPDGTVTAEHLPDLLTSEDKYFRPVNMEFGPDGCLYIADWYNKIISHNEVPTSHPDRDRLHGRIWRIRHVSQKPRTIPDFSAVSTEDLVEHLQSPSLWAKRAAWHQISDRPLNETSKLVSALATLSGDTSQGQITRILALWSLEAIKHYDEKLMAKLLASPEHDLRRGAVRSLASFSLSARQIGTALDGLIDDANPMVRSQVLRTLFDVGQADNSTIDILVRASKPALPGNEMGGAYERKFERYLALKALDRYPVELNAYLNTAHALQQPPTNLLWAIQALPKEQKESRFPALWRSAKIKELDESTFIMVCKMLANPAIYTLVKPVFEDARYAAKYLDFALKNQGEIQSDALSSLLEAPARRMLASPSDSDKQLALDAIGRFEIGSTREVIIKLIHDQTPSETLTLALKTLEADPKANKDVFTRVSENERFEFDIRLAALHSLAKSDVEKAIQTLQKWIPELDHEQKQLVSSVLSGSDEGVVLLTRLYDKKLLTSESFNLSSAERVFNSNPNNATGHAIMEGVKKRIKKEEEAFNSKLSKYMEIAEKKEGNAQKGKVLFQTCLMCHRVGKDGHNIAPALDGSAARDNEAILTAMLDPDAAVEGGYALYRVTKKDNSNIEGYLVNKNERGTTIAFMGGSSLFIEINDIKNQGFVGGRSFMPKGLIDAYSDNEVADLLAYIRTLK